MRMERLTAIWGVAGLLCFGLAGVVSGVLPILHLGKKVKVQTIEQAVPRASEDWLELSRRYPADASRVPPNKSPNSPRCLSG